MNQQSERNLWDFRREFERFFDDFWGREEGGAKAQWHPTVELSEADGAFHLFVEMPGVRREDVKVEVRNNEITITGNRSSEKRQGSFYRSLALPAGIDAEKVEAAMNHGVLEILAPRASESTPRQVPVRESIALSAPIAPAQTEKRAEPAMPEERAVRIESSGDSERYAS